MINENSKSLGHFRPLLLTLANGIVLSVCSPLCTALHAPQSPFRLPSQSQGTWEMDREGNIAPLCLSSKESLVMAQGWRADW